VYPYGVSWPPSLPGKEVSRVEDKKRKKVTVWEAAEYLGLTPGKVLDMVERGVLKADKFAGLHSPGPGGGGCSVGRTGPRTAGCRRRTLPPGFAAGIRTRLLWRRTRGRFF
jgi:excisionase family DNA binding protein